MRFSLRYIFYFLLIIHGCKTDVETKKRNVDEKEDRKEMKKQGSGKDLYSFNSEAYDFTVVYPGDWGLESFQAGNKQYVLNIFPENARSTLNLPAIVHARPDNSFIGIYPDGFGTELPMGKTRPLDSSEIRLTGIPIEFDRSSAFILEDNRSWAYYLVPESPPASWDEYGFIFAQSAIDNFREVCLDHLTGKKKEIEDCDPMTGDTIKRLGEIRQNEKDQLVQILISLSFSDNPGGSSESDNVKKTSDLIVEKPQNSAISSPLIISGKARGPWYFEGSFTISLEKNGEKLAETSAMAKGDWMTDDFVPFTASLSFSGLQKGEKAMLVFRNSNPSGKNENQKHFKMEVWRK